MKDLQTFIDDAGFGDLVLDEMPRRTSAGQSKIVSIAGLQLMQFDSPSYGETLLYTMMSDAISSIQIKRSSLYTRLVGYLVETCPDICPDTETGLDVLDRIMNDTDSLTTEQTQVIARTDLPTKISEIREESAFKEAIAESRQVQNLLLIWFLNSRLVNPTEATWTISGLYGSLTADDLDSLQGFMYEQLKGSSPDEDATNEGEA